ncbi:hypothetical protein [Streptomyces sp. NPDC002205]|uniref:hypothetical protein n=1 Tax=Streptomyces sp. NPDC002205 TaxID=3154411 RepID=UPI00332751FC
MAAAALAAPGRLHDLKVSDVECTDGRVRLVQHKNRAGRIRADLHMEQPALREEADPYFAGTGARDVPGPLRSLLTVTDPARESFAGEPWVFLAVIYRKSSVHPQRHFLGLAAALMCLSTELVTRQLPRPRPPRRREQDCCHRRCIVLVTLRSFVVLTLDTDSPKETS